MEHAINTASEKYAPTKVPILKITINKKYNNRSTAEPAPSFFETVNPRDAKANLARGNARLDSPKLERKDDSRRPSLLGKNDGKHAREKRANAKKEEVEPSRRTWKRKGDLSRENVRNRTRSERLRHLNTKAQRELEVLTIRLKALKERHRYEEKEIAKLNKYLNDPPKYAASRTTKAHDPSESAEDDNEDECERMLWEVRNMKRTLEETPVMKMLRERYEDAKPAERVGDAVSADVKKDESAIEIKEEFIDFAG